MRFPYLVMASLLGCSLGGSGGSMAWAQPAPQVPLLEVLTPQARHVGLPIHWDDGLSVLLEPSGRMVYIPAEERSAHRLLSEGFAPQTLAAARAALQAELGAGYETADVGPYVIIAPQGHIQRWRDRFRVLVSGFYRYFELRGWQLRNPDFPLCVVILPSEVEFTRYCQREGLSMQPNLRGIYVPRTNRCVLYELTASRGDGLDWLETERTVVHEAVHQLAFNTGIHERLVNTPLWIVEGLATMLEERSLLESRGTANSIGARVNPQQMLVLQPLLSDPARLQRSVTELVRSDVLFGRNAAEAYAVSWAMTFYMAERMTSSLAAYTQHLARTTRFHDFSAAEREQDFQRYLECDTSVLSIQLQRFFSKL
jgi:hypothetical protein